MRLDTAARRAKQREAAIRREVEARETSSQSVERYTASSMIDCKGECGRIVMRGIGDGTNIGISNAIGRHFGW